MKTIKLICVTENNNNKFYNMTENGDGTFTVEYGRVDSTSQKKAYPMSKWNAIYAQKTGKGYKDITALYVEDNSPASSSNSSNSPFFGIISRLQNFAKKMVQDNYRISSRAVTPAMISEAQSVIDDLVNISKAYKGNFGEEFNRELIKLFGILPRKMKKVQDFLFDLVSLQNATKDEIYHELNRIIRREQDMLDALSATASIQTPAKENEETDLLGQLGLEMQEKDADLEKTVLDMLGDIKDKYINCWYVKNIATQERYDDHLKAQRGVHKSEMLFWHGSKNENWLSILTKGLMIRPSGVATTGSMFGPGCYFADKARKSYGYTSGRGSYWAHGSSNTAFMAIFSVNVGKYHRVYKHTYECYDFNKDYLKKKGNFDSVYALKGADLVNDEYIVYDPSQCTIHALVELRG